MVIDIEKENEVVYFSVDKLEKKLMNFDNLVALSEKIVSIEGKFDYEIICTDSSSIDIFVRIYE